MPTASKANGTERIKKDCDLKLGNEKIIYK